MQRVLRTFILTFVALIFGVTPYAMPAPEQQNTMKACNEQATAKELVEGKAFIKKCLSAKSWDNRGSKDTQQNNMKTCTKGAGAKNLKGDERSTL